MKRLIEIINIVRVNTNKPIVEQLLDSQSLISDLGFDSLDLAELTVRIEKEFGIDVFSDGIVTTIKEIQNKLNL